MAKGDNLFYGDLSYQLTGILFNVHNELGRYSREKQYGDLLEKYLKLENIKYNRELRIGETGNVADFLVDDKIIIELKAKPVILKDDYYQVQRYLQSLNKKLGILVNFRNKYIKPIRIIKIETDNQKKYLY